MGLTDLLDQIDRLDQEATKGPWEKLGSTVESNGTYEDVITTEVDCSSYCYGGRGGGVLKDKDAEFIALARTALPKLAEAVYHVLDLLDVVEKSDKYSYDFGGNKAPSLVTTNEVRRAITDAMEADDD